MSEDQGGKPESPSLDRNPGPRNVGSGLESSTVAAIHRAAGDMGDAEKRLSAVLVGDSDEPVYSLREAVASLRKAADTLADAAEEEARR